MERAGSNHSKSRNTDLGRHCTCSFIVDIRSESSDMCVLYLEYTKRSVSYTFDMSPLMYYFYFVRKIWPFVKFYFKDKVLVIYFMCQHMHVIHGMLGKMCMWMWFLQRLEALDNGGTGVLYAFLPTWHGCWKAYSRLLKEHYVFFNCSTSYPVLFLYFKHRFFLF